MLFPIRDKIKTMKNKVIRKVFFPLILAKDQKNCDGFGEIKNKMITKKNKGRKTREEKIPRLVRTNIL
ncbi:hypothetical protein ADJ80_08450 [Aggregatibacter aphrophilus]|uniref:Uncharacterized protein n=1 Tax=Aggregatibacter aphrophilus TaxID=732 RepID=A0ABX9VSW4_AGGAP|nr:hypothetical protein ADJ80_08450 [Aggregatibacter aphrophilus]RMW80936.1 hypothetical protein DOL88_08860 [Aggregatibacter aphrophilus]